MSQVKYLKKASDSESNHLESRVIHEAKDNCKDNQSSSNKDEMEKHRVLFIHF